jgi:anti-anti-sigma factor
MNEPVYSIAREPAAGGDVRLVLSGEFDLVAHGALRASLLDAVAGCSRRVVVDLRYVTLLDASAIGVLVSASHAARAVSSSLTVINAHGRARRVLEITGVLPLLVGGHDLSAETTTDHRPVRLTALPGARVFAGVDDLLGDLA